MPGFPIAEVEADNYRNVELWIHYADVPTEYRKPRLSWFLFYMKVGKSWRMTSKRARTYERRLLKRSGIGYQDLLEFGRAD